MGRRFETISLPSPTGDIEIRRIPEVEFTIILYRGISAHLCELDSIAERVESLLEPHNDKEEPHNITPIKYYADMRRFRRRNASALGRMISPQEAIGMLYTCELLFPITRLGLRAIGEGQLRPQTMRRETTL